MSQPPLAWKLYDNPHYAHHPYKCRLTKSRSSLHGRSSDFSDFFRAMEREPDLSDLDNAIAHIKQLRAELDLERRMRRRVESINRSLSRELEEERRRRESAEEACRKLTDEMACVQEEEKRAPTSNNATDQEKAGDAGSNRESVDELVVNSIISSAKTKTASTTKSADGEGLQRKEVENPHIKRGIKGLEFPRVVRARGGGGGTGNPPSSNSREGRPGGPGSNLECQRAQLRVLLRQRSPAGSGLVAAAHNLVM